MTWYHATFRKNLASISKAGLRGDGVEQNWPGATPGVYLARVPEACIFVMLEQYLKYGDPDSNPSRHIENIVLIVIDDTRIDPRKLGPDPLIERTDVALYSGIIDVTGMPVISVDDVMQQAAPAEPAP